MPDPTPMEIAYLNRIDRAIEEAAKVLDLFDVQQDPDESTEAYEERYDLAYEERHHCSVCTVRSVMETVWPAVEAYTDYLRHVRDVEPRDVDADS